MLTRQRIWMGITCVLMLWCIGCGTGDGLNRQAILGNVTWEGVPLDTGSIRFEPVSNDIGTIAEATITNGVYTIERAAGLVPGEYKIMIFSPEASASQDTSENFFPGAGSALAKDRIPACYNLNTILKKTVTDGGENQVDFNRLGNPPAMPGRL